MTLEAIIGVILTFLSMVVGWVVLVKREAVKRAKERDEERERTEKILIDTAYEKGLHESVHVELKTDVVAAHEKLRTHDREIAELKRNDAAHAEVHNAILSQMEQMHKTIDTIHRVIMSTPNK